MKMNSALFFTWALLCSALAWVVASGSAMAHPGLHEQIAMLDGKISKEESYQLYAQRAHLYVENGDHELALQDLASAEQIGPREPLLYEYGSIYLQQGDATKALAFFDEALLHFNKIPQIHQSRAKALKQLGRNAEAVAALKTSFGLQKHPAPGLFVEAAELLMADKAEGAPSALELLDLGMKQLGVLGQLQEKAIEIEASRGHYAQAIERTRAMGEERRFNPYWRVELAELLLLNDQHDEAQAELNTAEALLNEVKSTPASRKLAARMATLQQQLAQARG